MPMHDVPGMGVSCLEELRLISVPTSHSTLHFPCSGRISRPLVPFHGQISQLVKCMCGQ